MTATNSFGTKQTLRIGQREVELFSLPTLAKKHTLKLDRLPFSLRILLESLLRNENGREVTTEDINRFLAYDPKKVDEIGEIPFLPARVILQDFTGVPAVVDLAAMRSAVKRLGGNPEMINPLIPVDLVIDHSVQVDEFGTAQAFARNANLEFSRNRERYTFLRWGQRAFRNFRVIPPASGIVHQVNLEYLASVVYLRADAGTKPVAYPDSLVGTDSHTTMINGLGILGWGVGGIEAEAVMLGQPIYMLAPDVIGFKLTGRLAEGVTATDLTLTVTQMLRQKGVVNKFVEFYGSGLSQLTLADRATIANMAPEYGATVGFFPVDDETLRYLRGTGRSAEQIDLVERYCKDQGLFRTDQTPDPQFTDSLNLDLSTVEPCLAGPKRPQDRVPLKAMKERWTQALSAPIKERGFELKSDQLKKSSPVTFVDQSSAELKHGSVVIAAITSCTNTSNPSVMLAAGLLAKKAVQRGLRTAPYVKTSLAPGSKAVSEYLNAAGLTSALETLGFFNVGYGCTTCIGNSGPLPDVIATAIQKDNLVTASVLSGNRNFEGRVHPLVRANYLASPPLVVAYALAGTVDIDLTRDPLGKDERGNAVFLRDVWPSAAEVTSELHRAQNPEIFRKSYEKIETANQEWSKIPVPEGALYAWDAHSTYIQEPPFFVEMAREVHPISAIRQARVLVKVGDSITTDHISPAGDIDRQSAAAKYLMEQGVQPIDFNSYGSRRGNDRVMTRGTFGNIRLKNQLAPGKEGSFTTHFPSGDVLSIYDAAQRYKQSHVPTIVLAGVDYGMGSSRDWAAKGTFLLGVRAVIAKSFERIHRSNLVGMGVLPLEFMPGEDSDSLALSGQETFSIPLTDQVKPQQNIVVEVVDAAGKTRSFTTRCRIDTPIEVDYFRNGGILHTVLRRLSP